MLDKLFLISAVLATIFSNGYAYFITVDADAEECFFDKVDAGTRMGKFHTDFLSHSH